MLTGVVVVDLTAAAAPERMRHRLACLPDVPAGVRVLVNVGALAPEPTAARVLREHAPRLGIEIQGTPFAVRRWLAAVREEAMIP